MTDIVVANVLNVSPIHADEAEIVPVLTAAAVTAGQILYQVTTTGKFGVADANASGKQQARGVALQSVAAGQAVSLLKRGHCSGFTLTSQSYDDQVFLTDTAGSCGDAAGTMTVPIGLVVGLTDSDVSKAIYFDFDWSVVRS